MSPVVLKSVIVNVCSDEQMTTGEYILLGGLMLFIFTIVTIMILDVVTWGRGS